MEINTDKDQGIKFRDYSGVRDHCFPVVKYMGKQHRTIMIKLHGKSPMFPLIKTKGILSTFLQNKIDFFLYGKHQRRVNVTVTLIKPSW